MTGSGGMVSWRQTPRWVKLLLVLSLVGNAAVVGIVGGWKMHYRERWPDEPGLSRQQARILHMVPETRREMARTVLLSRQDEVNAAREAMLAAQREMIGALQAEPFSVERLSAALAARHAAAGKVWGIGYEQVAEIAVGLTAAERAEMAERMDERFRRWMERRQRNR